MLGTLIYLIVIFFVVSNIISKKKRDGAHKPSASRQETGGRTEQYAGEGRRSHTGAGAGTGGSGNRSFSAGNRSYGAGRSGGAGNRTSAAAKGSTGTARRSAGADADAGSGADMSTTEYLRQKALEDAKDHARENSQEERRLHQETGGRMTGMRHLEWEEVPKGTRVVRCRYCAAENLISEYRKPEDYTCYFCREVL